MSNWTEEKKQLVIDKYTEGNPTPENSTELCKEIAEELEESPNGIRMVLIQAGVYVKKDATTPAKGKGGTSTSSEKAPRVSKESQIADLKAAIEAKGATVDDDILDKLTGKAAVYFTKVIGG